MAKYAAWANGVVDAGYRCTRCHSPVYDKEKRTAINVFQKPDMFGKETLLCCSKCRYAVGKVVER